MLARENNSNSFSGKYIYRKFIIIVPKALQVLQMIKDQFT